MRQANLAKLVDQNLPGVYQCRSVPESPPAGRVEPVLVGEVSRFGLGSEADKETSKIAST